MPNHYANAIEIIAHDMTLAHMRDVCIDYAKRHPKAFVSAAKNAGNRRAQIVHEAQGLTTLEK